MAPRSHISTTGEERAWALVLGTLFFAVVAYWLVAVSIPPSAIESSEIGLTLRSILSADAAWFVLLGWVLTSSFYLGFSRWPKFLARYRRWPRAARTVAWKHFKRALWFAIAFSLLWLGLARQIGLLAIENPGVEPTFLLREFHLLTDPLASFVLLFVVLDVIRSDLFAHARGSRYASVMALVVSLAVEVWVWAEYLGLGFDVEKLLPLILAVLWMELRTYESLVSSRAGGFWSRLGWGLGAFLVFGLGVSLVVSPWSSGWSFFVAKFQYPTIALALGTVAFASANIAVLQRFSRHN